MAVRKLVLGMRSDSSDMTNNHHRERERERERANRSIRSSNNPFPQWGDPPRPDPKLDWAMINEQFIYQRFFLLSVTGEVVVFHNRNN